MKGFKIENGVLIDYIEEEGVTEVTIPDGVTSIGGGAFYGCTSLKSITIPDSVTSMGGWAFYDCTSLKSITIPDSVTSIGGWVFYGCTSLKSPKANYKAFNLKKGRLFCQDYEYTPDEWSEEITEPVLCKKGYHFCTNLFSIFNYYYGEIDKEIAICECEVGDKVFTDGDKSVTTRIKPVKRLYREDVIRILNEGAEENV